MELTEPNTVRLTEPQTVCKFDDNPDMDSKIKSVLANNLALLMASSHKYATNNKLAAATGLGLGTINRIRNQESAASIETIDTIAGKFGISASQLIDENLFNPKSDTDGASVFSLVSEPLPEWLLPLIEAAKDANLRGSLPPNAVKNLIGLLHSLPGPPTGNAITDDTPSAANSLRQLAGKPKPT